MDDPNAAARVLRLTTLGLHREVVRELLRTAGGCYDEVWLRRLDRTCVRLVPEPRLEDESLTYLWGIDRN